MALLLLAEHDNSTLSDQTHKTLSGALQIDPMVDLLICGHACDQVAKNACSLAGIRRVLYIDHPQLAHLLAEDVAAILHNLADQYQVFASAATSNGKNIMPRLAALLDVMQVSEIIEVLAPDIYKRPIYASNAIEVVQALDEKKVITFRASAFTAGDMNGNAELVPLDPPSFPNLTRFIKETAPQSERPDLSSAKVVVSGGRGLGSAEQFMALLDPLANKLNAALGASRAAVDAGYAPNDWQVGQTGKIVAPDLYIAIGISGAIQHLAGMSSAKTIVAINKDEEAPIMKIADISLAADLFEAVPELTAKL